MPLLEDEKRTEVMLLLSLSNIHIFIILSAWLESFSIYIHMKKAEYVIWILYVYYLKQNSLFTYFSK